MSLSNGQFNYVWVSGFHPFHPTVRTLIQMCDNWFENMNNRKLIGVVFLDIWKTLHHSILREKVEFYGAFDRELMWFKSYLTARQQRFVNGHLPIGNYSVKFLKGLFWPSAISHLYRWLSKLLRIYCTLFTCGRYANICLYYWHRCSC